MKILHVISGLNQGGGEIMLHRVLAHSDRERFAHHVISLTDIGPIGRSIEALGVPVWALGLGRRAPVSDFARLVARLRAEAPDLVQTWLYHGNVIGGVAARLAGRAPQLWSIHNTDLSAACYKPATRALAHMGAPLSRALPAAVLYCAESARRAHEGIGYARAKGLVLPNGFDTGEFKPDPAERVRLRAELGVPEEAPLVGLVGRFSPQKDVPNFMGAAARVLAQRPEARFLLCGDGMDAANGALEAMRQGAGLPGDRVLRLGIRRDVPRVMAALDVLALSSRAEAFPLVLGEALAAGVPCAATDVGDAAVLVGEDGRLVPPGDAAALGEALNDLLGWPAAERRAVGSAGRARIVREYELTRVVARYEALYTALVAGRGASDALAFGET